MEELESFFCWAWEEEDGKPGLSFHYNPEKRGDEQMGKER